MVHSGLDLSGSGSFKKETSIHEEQVYFECHSMNCHESLHMPLLACHTKTKLRFQPFLRPGMFSGRNGRSAFGSTNFKATGLSAYDEIQRFQYHVQMYSKRKLSRESDSLKAFQGIMSHCFTTFSANSRKLPENAILGLPVSLNNPDEAAMSFFVSLTCWYHPWKRR